MPELGGNAWDYLKECLEDNWVSSAGPFVDRFESMVAEYVGASHGVATVNGTAALHTALLIAGVGAEDEVLVSSLSFIAPANAIRYVGAWPVFVDAEPQYWQMDPSRVVEFLRSGCQRRDGALYDKSTGRRVKAILPVHILGHPCDMDPILEAAAEFELTVIEDATESLGSRYKGRMVGNLGDIGCLSFNGNKIITTGGGGMVVTGDQEWAERARYLTTQAKDDPVEYVHHEIGYNYRLTNVLAAMGVAQMEQLDEFIAKKRALAGVYAEAFRELEDLTLMVPQPDTDPTYWLYTVLLHGGTTLADRKRVISGLNEAGIGARPLWHTLHDLPPYRECPNFEIEHAVRLYERGISLPSSVGLAPDQQQRCIDVVGTLAISSG